MTSTTATALSTSGISTNHWRPRTRIATPGTQMYVTSTLSLSPPPSSPAGNQEVTEWSNPLNISHPTETAFQGLTTAETGSLLVRHLQQDLQRSRPRRRQRSQLRRRRLFRHKGQSVAAGSPSYQLAKGRCGGRATRGRKSPRAAVWRCTSSVTFYRS